MGKKQEKEFTENTVPLHEARVFEQDSQVVEQDSQVVEYIVTQRSMDGMRFKVDKRFLAFHNGVYKTKNPKEILYLEDLVKKGLLKK